MQTSLLTTVFSILVCAALLWVLFDSLRQKKQATHDTTKERLLAEKLLAKGALFAIPVSISYDKSVLWKNVYEMWPSFQPAVLCLTKGTVDIYDAEGKTIDTVLLKDAKIEYMTSSPFLFWFAYEGKNLAVATYLAPLANRFDWFVPKIDKELLKLLEAQGSKPKKVLFGWWRFQIK